MNRPVLLCLLLGLAGLPACDDASQEPASAGKAPVQDGPISAAALEGELLPKDSLDTALAAQIFWKRLRETWAAYDEIELTSRWRLDDPFNADAIEKKSTSLVDAGRKARKDGVEDRTEVRRLPLGKVTSRRAQLLRFVGGTSAVHFRNMVLHPASPAMSIKDVTLYQENRWRSGTLSGEFGAAFDHIPTMAELQEAVAAGAKFVVATTTGGEIVAEQQVPRPVDLVGREGRDLPIPLIYLPLCNQGHIERSANGTNSLWQVETSVESVEHDGAVISTTFRGDDPGRKIVLCAGRRERLALAGRGRDAIDHAILGEIERVLAVYLHNDPMPRLPVSIEIAHVLDCGSGYSFLQAIARPGEVVLGVIDVEDAAPEDWKGELLLRFEEAATASLVERSVYSSAADYVGKEASWSGVDTDLDVAGVDAATVRALHQERVPVVEVAITRRAGRVSPVVPERWPRVGAPATPSRPSSKVGAVEDTFVSLTTARAEAQVALARLAAIASWRAARSCR